METIKSGKFENEFLEYLSQAEFEDELQRSKLAAQVLQSYWRTVMPGTVEFPVQFQEWFPGEISEEWNSYIEALSDGHRGCAVVLGHGVPDRFKPGTNCYTLNLGALIGFERKVVDGPYGKSDIYSAVIRVGSGDIVYANPLCIRFLTNK